MSRKTKKKRGAGTQAPPPRRPPFRKVSAALAACLLLLCAAIAATHYEPIRRAAGLAPLTAPVAQGTGGLQPAKEYVYAGGPLVATEEPAPGTTPTPTPAGLAPTNLKATAASASAVHLEWDAPSGAIGYVVERRNSLGGQPAEIPTGSASPAFDDSVPAGDSAYVYRVKAIYQNGPSAYGNYDLATTVPFTDAHLQGVAIKADH